MSSSRTVEAKLNNIVRCIGGEDYPKATQLIYTLIRELSRDAEAIVNLRAHASALYAARHKSRRSGLGSCRIPLPNIDNTDTPPQLIFEFDEHGSTDNSPTVQISISDNAPLDMKKIWEKDYNYGKLTIPPLPSSNHDFWLLVVVSSWISSIVATIFLFVNFWIVLLVCISAMIYTMLISPNYKRINSKAITTPLIIWNVIGNMINITNPDTTSIIFILIFVSVISTVLHIMIGTNFSLTNYRDQSNATENSTAPDMQLPDLGPPCHSCHRISLKDANYCPYCKTPFTNDPSPPFTRETIALRPNNKV